MQHAIYKKQDEENAGSSHKALVGRRCDNTEQRHGALPSLSRRSTPDGRLIEICDEVLTLSDAANYLKVSERTMWQLAKDGQVPSFRVGNAWRFYLADLRGLQE